jgi:nickel/cobalt transporter (NicO) family protein
LLHGLLEEPGGGGVDGAVFTDLRVGHAGVARGKTGGRIGETGGLAGAGGDDAGAQGGGGFARFFRLDFGKRERGGFDVEVDAVEQRAGDAGAVALNLRRGAAALTFGVSQISAGTGVHRGDEHEGAGKGDFAGGAGDGDFAVLEGLAKDFEGGAVELGEFIHEEDAVVGEGDFAGAGDGAAAEEADIADGVVRGAKGALEAAVFGGEGDAGGGLDGEDFEKFVERGLGHDGGDAAGDHAFAGAGAADHQEIMPAGDGDFDGAAEAVLAFDFGEVDGVLGLRRAAKGAGGGVEAGDEFFAGEKTGGFVKRGDGVDGDALDEGGFLGGGGGEEDAGLAELAGEEREGEAAGDGAGAAGEAQLAGDEVGVEFGGRELAGGGENGEGDGEIEERAGLAEVAGGEVDDGLGLRGAKAAIVKGGPDAVGGFLDGGVGEADEEYLGFAGFTGVDLDLHGVGVNPEKGARGGDGEHEGNFLTGNNREKQAKDGRFFGVVDVWGGRGVEGGMVTFQDYVVQGHAWLFLPAAVVLGALHGLEPGHSKTMMAAFIVAVRGTVAQAVLLGVSATVSHTAIIWVLAFVGLRYAGQVNVEGLEPYFQVATGVLVMGLAGWMFWRTRREQAGDSVEHHHEHGHHEHEGHHHHHDEHEEHGHQHEHGHSHSHSHGEEHHHHHAEEATGDLIEDAHERAHAREFRERFANREVTTGQIILFGLTGGLLPCPSAFAVLLVCLQLKQISLGFAVVLAFSLGLAITLVSVGTVAALSVRQASKHFKGFGTWARKAPYVSSTVMVLIGLIVLVQGVRGLG